MNHDADLTIRRPGKDERTLWDVLMCIRSGFALLVAYDIGLFTVLAEKPRTLQEAGEALKIASRPAEALLTASVSMGLVSIKDGCYSLTPLAEDYLIEKSPTYFGGYLDYAIANSEVLSFESMKKAVLRNKAQVYGGEEIYGSHRVEADRARRFTAMMHSHSMAAALAWPEKVDLTGHHLMLDVGGGSGAHSIGAASRWPNLRAIILDLPPVCETASGYVERFGLANRIETFCADMWTDPYPSADIHFYADIYHDFTPERCRFLTRKSFESLDAGGRLIVHEMLLNDEKSGPPTVAGYSLSMLLWTEGQQFSGRELKSMLTEAGFADVEATPTFGYWNIVSGRKP